MEPDAVSAPERSYGCTYGCGNPYDVVLINVTDSSTLFLCVPCFVKTASDIVDAMTNPDDPDVRRMTELGKANQGEMVNGPAARKGRRNAPVDNDDPDLLVAFDDRLTLGEVSAQLGL